MKLYRYIPFEGFIDIIQTHELVFVSPLVWEDKYEGILFRALQTPEGIKKIISILDAMQSNFLPPDKDPAILQFMINIERCQCWSKFKDSVAMWSIYSHSNRAIMIKTDRQKLERLTYGNEKVHLENVEYKYDDRKGINLEYEIKLAFTGGKLETFNPCKVFYSKRKAFKHEKEVRVFTSVPLGVNTPARVEINIPISDFIEEVLVHPCAPNWYVKIVEKTCQLNGINFMGKSKLYEFELPEK